MDALLIDGVTGSGKSSALKYLRDKYTQRVTIGRKLTTRPRRASDNDWEFEFVEDIPPSMRRYAFSSVGWSYAIDKEEVARAATSGKIYAVTCVDRTTAEMLAHEFATTMVYVYRAWSDTDLEQLLVARQTDTLSSTHLRRQEVASVAADYAEKIGVINHVILNVGTLSAMTDQFSRILQL